MLRAIAMIDCDRPRVVLPLCEFLSAYVRNNSKIKTVNDPREQVAYGHICNIAGVLIKRFTLPKWYLDMGGHTAEVEDFTDGRLEEQRAMREAQINLFGRLCVFEPLKMDLLQGIAGML